MTTRVAPRDSNQERRRVARLFTRAAFGASVSEIDQWTAKGYAAAVEHLLGFAPASQPQVDQAAVMASAMPLDAFPPDIAGATLGTAQLWWLERMATTSNPLEEKLTLHWHNHFATAFSKVGQVSLMLRQNGLLRSMAGGNFRELCNAITADPAMLIWLDGNTNHAGSPNENFGREFLELFTLGRNRYTQQDVRAAARSFTGYTVDQFGNVRFDARRYDASPKTLLGATGRWAAADVTNIVLDHHPQGPVAADYIATRTAAFFHQPEPEKHLVAAMAAAFRGSGYEIKPMLRALFIQPEFLDGPTLTIKSPAELVAGTFKALAVDATDPNWPPALASMGQQLFNPPSVAGWRGGAAWANTATSLARYNFASKVADEVELNQVSDVLDSVDGDPHRTAMPWMNKLGLLDLRPRTRQAIDDYTKAGAAAGASDYDLARGVLTLLLASPDYNLR
ncbi:MAG: DUF1800 domain-containing protein [Actinobacteria bacterium]|nr:DUF1800 domain-containing protein [Actinomycetota bacterium]